MCKDINVSESVPNVPPTQRIVSFKGGKVEYLCVFPAFLATLSNWCTLYRVPFLSDVYPVDFPSGRSTIYRCGSWRCKKVGGGGVVFCDWFIQTLTPPFIVESLPFGYFTSNTQDNKSILNRTFPPLRRLTAFDWGRNFQKRLKSGTEVIGMVVWRTYVLVDAFAWLIAFSGHPDVRTMQVQAICEMIEFIFHFHRPLWMTVITVAFLPPYR